MMRAVDSQPCLGVTKALTRGLHVYADVLVFNK